MTDTPKVVHQCNSKPPEERTFGDLLAGLGAIEAERKLADERIAQANTLSNNGDKSGRADFHRGAAVHNQRVAAELSMDLKNWPGVDRIQIELESEGMRFCSDSLTQWRAKRCIADGVGRDDFDKRLIVKIAAELETESQTPKDVKAEWIGPATFRRDAASVSAEIIRANRDFAVGIVDSVHEALSTIKRYGSPDKPPVVPETQQNLESSIKRSGLAGVLCCAAVVCDGISKFRDQSTTEWRELIELTSHGVDRIDAAIPDHRDNSHCWCVDVGGRFLVWLHGHVFDDLPMDLKDGMPGFDNCESWRLRLDRTQNLTDESVDSILETLEKELHDAWLPNAPCYGDLRREIRAEAARALEKIGSDDTKDDQGKAGSASAKKPQAPYPSPDNLSEDKWIFSNIHRHKFDDLRVEHIEWCQSRKKTQRSLSRNQYKTRSDRYAEYHDLPIRRFKGACKCPDCQPVTDT